MNLPMFPEPINGEISSKDFLTASRGVIRILDYCGKMFMPVKHNLQVNIDKIAKIFNLNRKNYSTLQKIIIEQKNEVESRTVIDALLWLGRGLHMIQLFFESIVNDFESGKGSEDLVACLNKSYELTLEPYHGYISQQLYGLLARMMPTRSQILQSIANGYVQWNSNSKFMPLERTQFQ
ncbi:PREDICTED: glycolipid transfer protein isoform X2 [Ceratosolen solmsi marchali]|uniref:Glycolipid transfer protein isoform X2 n=1 Tax=Ceratosolen solmsi marchali TaxID=326594 RepID=A0AAJ7DWV0_9HYME|nr:PREDICTED: glycolipid transfer protein isoform X2 [Ceratosolen solmsi marchali]